MTLKGQTAECQLAQWTEMTEVNITAQFRDKPTNSFQKNALRCVYAEEIKNAYIVKFTCKLISMCTHGCLCSIVSSFFGLR